MCFSFNFLVSSQTETFRIKLMIRSQLYVKAVRRGMATKHKQKTKASCTKICIKAVGRPTPSLWPLVHPVHPGFWLEDGVPQLGWSQPVLPFWPGSHCGTGGGLIAERLQDSTRTERDRSLLQKRKENLSYLLCTLKKCPFIMEVSSWKYPQKMYFEARKMLHFLLKDFSLNYIVLCFNVFCGLI